MDKLMYGLAILASYDVYCDIQISNQCTMYVFSEKIDDNIKEYNQLKLEGWEYCNYDKCWTLQLKKYGASS